MSELAGRCCRRWPAADVLSVLERLPADRRQAWRQQPLQQLIAELCKLRDQQSHRLPSTDVAPPSSARTEAILSFLEPHLLADGPATQPADVWSWADWRGRVQRWAGWPASELPVSRPRPCQDQDRSASDQPPDALWHRFIGRAAPDKTQVPGMEAAGESTTTDAVDTTDRCELLKRDVIRSLTGLGDMLRRDGSSSSFYSIESDSLQERSEPSELGEEAARREAQAMMVAGVGRQSSSDSEPGGGVPASSDGSSEVPAHQPTVGGPVQLTLEARRSCESTDGAASESSMATACDRAPAAERLWSPPSLVQEDGQPADRLSSTGPAPSDSGSSDSCVQLTARRADGYLPNLEITAAHAVTTGIPVYDTQSKPEPHAGLIQSEECDQRRPSKFEVNSRWCSVNEFSLGALQKWSAAGCSGTDRQPDRPEEGYVSNDGQADGETGDRGLSLDDSTPMEPAAAAAEPAAPQPIPGWQPRGIGLFVPAQTPAAGRRRHTADGRPGWPTAADRRPPPAAPPGGIDLTGAESHPTADGESVEPAVSGAACGPVCQTEDIERPGDGVRPAAGVDPLPPAAAAAAAADTAGTDDSGMIYTAQRCAGRLQCGELSISSVHRPDSGKEQTTADMHAELRPPVFQFHVSKPPPATSGHWDLDTQSSNRTVSSNQAPEAAEGTQCPADGTAGSWSHQRDKESSDAVWQEELSLEELLSDGRGSSVLISDDDADPSAEEAADRTFVVSSSSPDVADEAAVLSSTSLGSSGEIPAVRGHLAGCGGGWEPPPLSGTSPSRIPRRRRPSCPPPSPPSLPAAGGLLLPHTSLLPQLRGITPSRPNVTSVLRGQTIGHGLAVAAGGRSRCLPASRTGWAAPAAVAGIGRYSAIHAGRAPRYGPPGAASSVRTLLPAALPDNVGSYGGSDQLDRALRAPSKQSQHSRSTDGRSESSDEDPNGITLSHTTRSKLKLLTKRNEMRKGLERSQPEPAAGHHQVAGISYLDRHERSRQIRQPGEDLPKDTVEARLAAAAAAAAQRSGRLAVRPADRGRAGRGSPRLPQPPAANHRPPRRAASHERMAPPHGQLQPSSPRKTTHALPSPRIERKAGSMQNLATQKPKQPPLPKSKTFGTELNKRSSVPSSASSVFGEHLERFAQPRAALEEAYRKLNSDNWEREVSGLTDLVRLFRHHPEAVSADLKTAIAAIVKQMKNLRSQVLRAAVQTSAEMFQHVGKAAEPNMDKMVALLLQKTSDTNKFIKADSNRALDQMLEHVSVPRAIVAVTSEGLGHRNSQVRATVARLLSAVVRRLGAAGSLSGQRDVTERLVPAAAQLVREGELQTRIHAKEIFHVWLQYPELDKVLGKYLSSSAKRDIDKVVDNMKNEVPSADRGSVSLTMISSDLT